MNVSLKFFEHFNTSNESSPSVAYHISFVTKFRDSECEDVNTLEREEQCEFVQKTRSCKEMIDHIDYLSYYFCVGNTDSSVLNGLIFISMVVWCGYLFTILGTTADRFFCPALTVISKVMGLSENLAGVTLLAFGNGSPDIFAALANVEGETSLMYAELLGAGTFIIGVIAGTIITVRQFKTNAYSLSRDCLFYIFSILFILRAMHDRSYSLFEAVSTVLIYVVYLTVVISDHLVMKQKVKERRRSLIGAGKDQDLLDIPDPTTLTILRRTSRVSMSDLDIILGATAGFTHNDANHKFFSQFLESINPIDKEDWNESGIFGKIFSIITAPGTIILLIVVPIVDYSLEKHGWTKLLSIIHLVVLPPCALIITGYFKNEFLNIPLPLLILGLSIILGVLVFFTSRTDQPPKYHLVYAVFSLIGAMLIIFIVANEVVNILTVIGLILNISESLLGFTVLAWGNSIGDLIANIAFARQGYPKMGFAACFGGPMFNTLMGIGLTFLLKMKAEGASKVKAGEGALGPTCAIFLIFVLTFTLLAFTFTNFVARRSIGFFMNLIYVMFITFAVLSELEYIHPYGTDHDDD